MTNTINFRKLKKDLIEEFKPTKLTKIKAFIKLGLIVTGSAFYFHQVQQQMEKNDQQGIIGSIEEVLKEQYDFIKSPFLILLHKAEGVRNNFYPDNKGFAVGYGYNPTQNSVEYNKNILDYAQVDEQTKKIILENAGKYKNQYGGDVPGEFKKIKFSKEQVEKMAQYAQNSYERSFFRVFNAKMQARGISGVRKQNIIKAYTELPQNKKAVLIHMAYKVGETNLNQYNKFFTHLIAYLETPSEDHKRLVAQSFTYKCREKNGRVFQDTRVEKLHANLFMQEMPANHESAQKVTQVKREPSSLTQQQKLQKAMQEVNEQISFGTIMNYVAQKSKNYTPVQKQGSVSLAPEMEVPREYFEDEEEADYEEEVDEDIQQATEARKWLGLKK